MLKIKDSIGLKELEKYGFKPKYDEDTGRIIAYEEHNKEKEYIGLWVCEKTKSKMRIFNKCKNEWVINPLEEKFDVDLLYDLIQAGLVEKVEE